MLLIDSGNFLGPDSLVELESFSKLQGVSYYFQTLKF